MKKGCDADFPERNGQRRHRSATAPAAHTKFWLSVWQAFRFGGVFSGTR